MILQITHIFVLNFKPETLKTDVQWQVHVYKLLFCVQFYKECGGEAEGKQ